MMRGVASAGRRPRKKLKIGVSLVLVLLALLLNLHSAGGVELHAAASAQWGPDFAAELSADLGFKKALRAQDLGVEMALEMSEQAKHHELHEDLHGNEEALDEHTAGELASLFAERDGYAESIGTIGDEGTAQVGDRGAHGAAKQDQLGEDYTKQLHQEEQIKETALFDTEKMITARIDQTDEKLKNLRDDGLVHMRRRGDNTEERMTKDDIEFAKQALRQQTEHEWRLEQRAQRTEARLDRMLQETRALLKKRDEADEARAAALESRLDAQARRVEERMAREEQAASLIRLAAERRGAAGLNTQRAEAIHQRGALRWRPRQAHERLQRTVSTQRGRVAEALAVAAGVNQRRDMQDTESVLRRARRRGVAGARGLGGLLPRSVQGEAPLMEVPTGDAGVAGRSVGVDDRGAAADGNARTAPAAASAAPGDV